MSSSFLGQRSDSSNRSRKCAATFVMQTPSASKSKSSATTSQRLVTLLDLPVSNYSARCRYLAYRKGLSDTVNIRDPSDRGGLKSDEYAKLNPLCKVPVAILHDASDDTGGEIAIYESAVICEYLAERFADVGPSFIPESVERRARARVIGSLLDIYLGPLHPYMYKANVEGDRVQGVARMGSVFDAIEHSLDKNGPYAIGDCLSVADCCLWGNWPFYEFMLPTFFGWTPTDGRPKLAAWRKHMAVESQASKDVYNEVFTALQRWWDGDRWVKLGMEALTSRPESSV